MRDPANGGGRIEEFQAIADGDVGDHAALGGHDDRDPVQRHPGRRLTAPLTYLRDGERLVVAASRAGFDHHPAWYLNLVADPEVEVQIGSNVVAMHARTADEPERSDYWRKLVAMNPDYGDYQARTTRKIPIVVLSPR